jgi:hypothetical protein
LQANVSTAYFSTGERDQDDGGRFAPFLADVKTVHWRALGSAPGTAFFGFFRRKKITDKMGTFGGRQAHTQGR